MLITINPHRLQAVWDNTHGDLHNSSYQSQPNLDPLTRSDSKIGFVQS